MGIQVHLYQHVSMCMCMYYWYYYVFMCIVQVVHKMFFLALVLERTHNISRLFVPNSRGNKAAVNPRPTYLCVLYKWCIKCFSLPWSWKGHTIFHDCLSPTVVVIKLR